nr:hypothetical protein [Tanacetum cinerariifolium]
YAGLHTVRLQMAAAGGCQTLPYRQLRTSTAGIEPRSARRLPAWFCRPRWRTASRRRHRIELSGYEVGQLGAPGGPRPRLGALAAAGAGAMLRATSPGGPAPSGLELVGRPAAALPRNLAGGTAAGGARRRRCAAPAALPRGLGRSC